MKNLKLMLLALLLGIAGFAKGEVCKEVGESRPMSVPVRYGNQTSEQVVYSGSYALLVGASDYQRWGHGWDSLNSVPVELDDLANVLVKQGFHVRIVCDPVAIGDGGLSEIDNFFKEYGHKDRRLLIFISGHGWVDNGDSIGFFAPVNSPLPAVSKGKAREMGFSSGRMISLLNRVQAKHVLVFVDMCYSAAIFTTKSPGRTRSGYSLIDIEDINRPSRWFLTAGSDGQETPSPSVFAPAVTLGLSGFADFEPSDGIIRASELFAFVRHVVANSRGAATTPRTGYVPLEARQIAGGGEPVFRYDPSAKKSIQQEIKSPGLQLLDTTTPAQSFGEWPDERYKVTYFKKEIDQNRVLMAFENAGVPYLSTNPILHKNTQTNGLACHPDAPISVVKAAAKALIENGVDLKIIDRATKNLDSTRYFLQALHYGRVSSESYRSISIADLELLDKYEGCPNEFKFHAEKEK